MCSATADPARADYYIWTDKRHEEALDGNKGPIGDAGRAGGGCIPCLGPAKIPRRVTRLPKKHEINYFTRTLEGNVDWLGENAALQASYLELLRR